MDRYSKIFLRNEFRTILGYRKVNFWILFSIFFITIGSLSFSRAGLEFLKQKMEDPFINWVDISREPKLDDLYMALNDNAVKAQFGYTTVEQNNFILEYVFNTDNKKVRVEGRTIENTSQLFNKITDSKNVVVKRNSPIEVNDIGLVVTVDLMKRLGYQTPEEYPLFINLTNQGDPTGIKNLGIKNFDHYQVVPIPIIAVVKQLPDFLDFLTTPYFSDQLEDDSRPFNLSIHPEYFDKFQVVVVNEAEVEMTTSLENAFTKNGVNFSWAQAESFYRSFRNAKLISVELNDTLSNIAILNTIFDEVLQKYPSHKAQRYYEYRYGVGYKLKTDYISVMFQDLGKIKEFQTWAKDDFNIRIDMAQIEAKENFKTFQLLSLFLSSALILISILFIIIFLYFLINAHFQKISKNLGTIMAFGLDNNNIIKIYLLVFIRLVLYGLIPASITLASVQLLFHFLKIVRDNGMPYINMNDIWIYTVLLGIIVLSIIATYIIMGKKLKSTPGDLIYERNN
jgi:hypothetical protein